MNALIGSGFNAPSREDFDKKSKFWLNYWIPNLGGREIVIVDNSEAPVPKLQSAGNVRVISVNHNLGQVGDVAHIANFLGLQFPKLGGWSMSWILPALIACCEQRDFIYFEQDALAFGEWENQIYADMGAKQLRMAFGDGSRFGSCEQSIFCIKHDFILEAITLYMVIDQGDGILLPEKKFEQMERGVPLIGRHTLPGGRNRPFDFEKLPFYGQKWTPEELEQLKIMGFIK